MSRYFDEQETIGREKRERGQGEALRLMAEQATGKSPFFRKTLDGLSLEPAQFASVKELEKLPVITREALIDLQKAEPPFGGLADPEAQIDRIFVSPGPVYEPHLSESDPLWARSYTAAGLGPHDIVLNAFSHHLVAAGLTFHGGLRRIGATVIPSRDLRRADPGATDPRPPGNGLYRNAQLPDGDHPEGGRRRVCFPKGFFTAQGLFRRRTLRGLPPGAFRE